MLERRNVDILFQIYSVRTIAIDIKNTDCAFDVIVLAFICAQFNMTLVVYIDRVRLNHQT